MNLFMSLRRVLPIPLVSIVFHSFIVGHALADELPSYDNKAAQFERALKEQQERMKAQERLLREYQAALDRQQNELQALKQQIDSTRQTPAAADRVQDVPYRIEPVAMPAVRNTVKAAERRQGTGVSRAADQAQKGTEATSISEDQPKKRPDVPLIAQQGGVLLRQGQVVVEPSLDFALIETNRVEVAGFTVLPAILVGNFNVSQVQRETYTAALTGRAGITDRLELEVRVPYVYRNDRETGRPIGSGSSTDETKKLTGYDLGDIEMAAHYQINNGTGRLPFFVGNIRAKSVTGTSPFDVSTDSSGNPTELPTGSGFWSVQPSITAILPSDPAVIFANLNYTWNISQNISGYGDVDPGDTFGGSIGVGFALNEKLSMSMAYDHTYVMETTQNGVSNNSAFHIGRMLFGGSYKTSDNSSVNLNFAVGVTDQAPDIETEVRMPITFEPFK